jgi:Flp pilus assembly protein TadD
MLMLSAALRRVWQKASANARLSPDELAPVLAAVPGKAHALHVSGLLTLARGDARRAALQFCKAADWDPDNAALCNNAGVAVRAAGYCAQALAFFRKAIRLAPHAPEPHANLGAILQGLGDIEAAGESLQVAMELRPDCAEIRRRLAEVRLTQECAAEAESLLRQAIVLEPDAVEAYVMLGRLAMRQRQWHAAGAYFDEAVKRQPGHVEALCGLAELGPDHRLEELTDQLLAARARAPDEDAQYRLEFALASLARLRHDVASEAWHLQRSLLYRPDDVRARVHFAKLLLQMGDYAAGWSAFEWRWKQPHTILPGRALARRRWLGEPLHDAPILLHAEQGFGDIIQFVRYAPLVAARGGRVIVEVPMPLRRLMTSLQGVERVISAGEPVPTVVWQCPLMSLPLAFGTTLDTVPADVPYLSPAAEEVATWRNRLPDEGLRVGIVWAGAALHPNDRRRSMPAAALAPLARVAGISFVSLQKHSATSTPVSLPPFPCLDLGGVLTDYAVTAAIIANLDLVITVCTSVAHLAGALGKEVWILLPFASEYRWLLNREDSPWYPSARLFRQPPPGDWASVVQRVACELRLRGLARQSSSELLAQ